MHRVCTYAVGSFKAIERQAKLSQLLATQPRLVVRGVAVEHVLRASRPHPHVLRAGAYGEGTRITYPPQHVESGGRVQESPAKGVRR